MMKSRLILVGGFLGAGKTTLLWEAAQKLSAKGLRVGLITNDQAPNLVDTTLLSRGAPKVEEVSGSCFCCNFPGLFGAITNLRTEVDAEVIIAEPVGSCTDLSATIIQPLKTLHAGDLAIAPLSVVIDPKRLSYILNRKTAGLHASAAYIYRKQMEEADMLVISKIDLLSSEELASLSAQVAVEFPHVTVFAISSKTGEGIDEWLDATGQRTDSGQRLAEVDYDIYAEGEAVLAWLNAIIQLEGSGTDWYAYTERFLTALSRRFDDMGASVGHLKLLIESGEEIVVGNLVGTAETMSVRGGHPVSPQARMTLNARVEMSPETLESIVHDEMQTVSQSTIVANPIAWKCLIPGRPTPTYRYDHLVEAL